AKQARLESFLIAGWRLALAENGLRLKCGFPTIQRKGWRSYCPRMICAQRREAITRHHRAMTTEEFANAKSLWKFVYAEECFRRVQSTCALILQNGIGENHPAYYPMIVAIYALYGKPFKKADLVGALPRNIVPAEFRPLH